MQCTTIVAFLLSFMAFPIAHAQQSGLPFQPGKWQIDSTITLSTGKQTTARIMACSSQGGDFWEHPRPGQQCKAPQVTTIANGYNVKLHCDGGSGQVHWTMQSNINETFSADGARLQATGDTSTQTIVPGQAPIQMTARIQATGKRTGPCDSKLKPAPVTPPADLRD